MCPLKGEQFITDVEANLLVVIQTKPHVSSGHMLN